MMNKEELIQEHLKRLKLSWIKENYIDCIEQATKKKITYQVFLEELLQGECDTRKERAFVRRFKQAKFPLTKSIDNFDWQWPEKIDQIQIIQLFDLGFIKRKYNAVFIGPVGVGKSHLSTALGIKACEAGYKVLFCNTIDMINQLISAQKQGRLKEELKKYQNPNLLIMDELGYLPIGKNGADLLFQIISLRYEQSSTIITTNRAYKEWPIIFNQDNTVTSAVLDRVLHHCESIMIDGSSYRMKKKIQPN